jgi:hypothetical protein
MEGYSVGIKGGVLKINDARLKEDLERVPGGDDIRIQQQDVPLDWHDKQAPENTAPPAPREDPDEEANDNAEQLRRSFRASHARNYAV